VFLQISFDHFEIFGLLFTVGLREGNVEGVEVLFGEVLQECL
jgi:hypothetical protein